MIPSKPIIVTGAAGFIGAQLVHSLIKGGHPVIGVDSLTRFEGNRELPLPSEMEKIDKAELFAWLRAKNPPLAAIFHLGACSDTTCLDTAFLDKWNTAYSQNLWTFAKEHYLPFYYASSAATYGDGALGYLDDEETLDALRPLNPYGLSKHRFDQWVLAQEKEGHAPPSWAGFKLFNVYGFGERHKEKMASVILHAFDQITATGSVRLFKSERSDVAHGQQKRDFIYVDDCVDVMRFAHNNLLSRGIYNLGTGQARSYLDLANAVFVALDKDPRVEYIPMPEALAARYQYFTEAKMGKLRMQGYSQKFFSLEEGVRRYIEHLRG